MNCCDGIIKYLLFAFNLVFSVSNMENVCVPKSSRQSHVYVTFFMLVALLTVFPFLIPSIKGNPFWNSRIIFNFQFYYLHKGNSTTYFKCLIPSAFPKRNCQVNRAVSNHLSNFRHPCCSLQLVKQKSVSSSNLIYKLGNLNFLPLRHVSRNVSTKPIKHLTILKVKS